MLELVAWRAWLPGSGTQRMPGGVFFREMWIEG
jgi:hypothetical protein